MKPAVSQVCTLNASFAEDIEDYAAGHCLTIEVWLTKLEEHLKSNSIDEVKRLLEDNGVTTPVASLQGGLFTPESDASRETWQHFEQRLAVCEQLGMQTIVVAGDIGAKPTAEQLQLIQQSLAKMGEAAARHNVRVAIEFQSSAVFANNLETAAAVISECAHESVGICLDVFQLWTGPSRLGDLAYLTSENLFHVQVCDLAGVPRELASDADRILPGEGDLPLSAIIDHLRSINYEGCVSIELMNPQIWQVPPRQFGEVAITAARRLLGMADMGDSE